MLPVGSKPMKDPMTAPQQDAAVPVSFSSSALAEGELLPLPSPHRKKKLLLTILVILGTFLVLLFGFILVSRYASLYARTVRNLGFDYRQGEQSSDSLLSNDTSVAVEIASQLQGESVSIDAVTMLFDENGGYTPTLTLYDYHRNDAESTLMMKTCAAFWLPVESTELKQTGDVCYTKSGGDWVQDDSLQIPDLYAYCFSVDEDDGFSLYQRYSSTVDDDVYLCELWLMEDRSGDETIYNTLYRYYDGDTLCGVRLLPSYSTDMLVFDIREYETK